MKKALFIFCLIASGSLLRGQSVKGLYVNQFSTILGNIAAEDSLLLYAQTNGFNYLALYELHIVHAQLDLTSFSGSAPLAAFINKAKTQYGIQQIGAIAENYWFFENRIHVYNQIHSVASQKFDVFNLEFEFWQTSATGPSGYYCTTYLQPAGFPCDTAGAFDFYLNELHKIDSLAATEGHISETYVGWPTAGQCHDIVANCDRVLVHAYVTNDASAYGYTQTRLSYFATSASVANVIVIFSSEPSFMGPWLATHSESTAWNTYSSDYGNETAAWTSGMSLIGYQWFDYTDLPYDLSLTINTESATDYTIENGPDYIIVSAPGIDRTTFELIDMRGESVIQGNSSEKTFEIPINNLPSGMYLLNLTNQTSGKIYSSKVIVTH